MQSYVAPLAKKSHRELRCCFRWRALGSFFHIGGWLLFMLLLSLANPATAAQVLSLDDCVGLVMVNNPTLKAARFALESAQQDHKMARADFFPTLSSSTSYTQLGSMETSGAADPDFLDQKKFNASLSLSQTLYAGGRLKNTWVRAAEGIRMVQADRDHIATQLVYQLRLRFFELMKAKEDVVVAQDTVHRIEADLASVEAFFAKELTAYAQVLQARADLTDARQNLSIAKNQVARKRSELFAMMHQRADSQVSFTGGLHHYAMDFEKTGEQCLEIALANRSDLKSLDSQLKMREKDAAIAKGKYHPMVTLDGGLYDQDKNYDELDNDQHNTYWSAGVNLSWKIFDGGRAWYEKKRALVEIKRIQEKYQEVRSNLETGIRIALLSLAEARLRMRTTSEGITAADEYYERESRRFHAGIATISSVLDAQVRVTRARGSHAQALLDYQLARAELDFLMGVSVQ